MSANSHPFKILLIDSDRKSLSETADHLTRCGFQPVTATDAESAWQLLDDGVAVVITDLAKPDTDGLEVIRFAKENAPHAIVIVVSDDSSVQSAVSAVREGAFDYLAKPLDLQELVHRIEMAIRNRALAAEIAALHLQLNQKHGLENMIGASAPMRSLYEKIQLVADTSSTVLVTGESGTGKELVARSLHRMSRRSEACFLPVNCAAIPESLVESELFGHVKGAFTGAVDRKRGFFEAADGGTLFIDEIGELQMSLQAKFLRAIENRTVMPVGSTSEKPVNVRVVAATNRDLREQVHAGDFREDLYYRLNVVELKLPPLRERAEDIPLLVRHFMSTISADTNRDVREITTGALELLKLYSWPGNVRELRNTLESIIVLSLKKTIDVEDLPSHITGQAESQLIIKPGMSMAEIEKEAMRRTLEHTGGNRTQAAAILKISVRTLQRKINDYKLDA